MHAAETAAHAADWLSCVGLAVVPDHDEVPAKVAQQVTQELTNLRLLDVFDVQAPVEPDAPSLGADRHSGDSRALVPPLPVSHHGRLPARRPGLAHTGAKLKTRFVYEGDMGARPLSPLFIRGHWLRLHCSMASSSRCRARRLGFWWLQPRQCSTRPTWSRWYLTANLLSISSATRLVLQMSVRYPCSMGPSSRYCTRRFLCCGESVAGRPGAILALSASGPPRSLASRQRMTLLGWHPARRATSACECRSSSNAMARRRGRSKSCAEPSGRVQSILQ